MTPNIKRRSLSNHELAAVDTLPPTLPANIRQLLASRGLRSDADLDLAMSGLASYEGLKDIEIGARILAEAILNQQSILVIGDFDADGATATAVSCLAIKAFGHAQVDFLVPDRFTLGYGLSAPLADIALTRRPDLVITVDNGISSIEGVALLKKAGVQVVITDHHLPGATLPDADAIINPNQPGCHFASKAACGCTLAFYLMAAVRARLQLLGWFDHREAPALAEYLDLVALATVADVVPLDRNNRILVHQGLKRIRAGAARPGIQALLAVAKKDTQYLLASDLGFAIGPRLNAAGRMQDMSLGIACLMADNPDRAMALASQLDALNIERRAVESGMQDQAAQWLKRFEDASSLPWGLCLFNEDWHEGVIGILASRIKDQLNRPVIVFAAADDRELKGSARSISGFHLRDALDQIATRHPGLLNRFGGHAMAAGLALNRADFAAFQKAFDQVVREQISEQDLQAVRWSDGPLTSDILSVETAHLLASLGPYGHHFPEPAFDGLFDIVDQRIVGDKHLKLVLTLPGEVSPIQAIAFNVDLSQWPTTKRQLSMRYQLAINRFRGQVSLQLMADCLTAV